MAAVPSDELTPSRGVECSPVPPARRVPDLAEDVLRGFAERPRALPPKYFYDAYGSQLFDRICDTPEYYPTRTEAMLLARHAGELIQLAAPDHLVELGAGSCRKTRYLLTACEQQGRGVRFWPFDVCAEMLVQAGEELQQEYDWLRLSPLVGDYTAGLSGMPQPAGRRLFAFLGGTIGNFSPEESRAFLAELRSRMGPGDHLLLGADRTKPASVLEAAYDDAAGLTARFNRNLLRVLNRELGANFWLSAWRHRAWFNAPESRIEMHLIAEREQRVWIGRLEREYRFAAGEFILTEISRKFSRQMLEAELQAAGFEVARHCEADEGYFSLVLARPA